MTLAVVAGLSAAGPVQWKPLGKGQTMKLTATKSAHQNEWAYWLHQEQPGIRGTLVGAIATGPQQEELKTLIEAAPDLLEAMERWVAINEGCCGCDLYDTEAGEKCPLCAARAAIAKAEPKATDVDVPR